MKALVIALALSFAVTALPAYAEPNDGAVTGQVINRTAGGGPVAGASVTLIAFGRKEQRPLGQKTAQTDAQGHYTFTDLDRDPNVAYITLSRFQEVNYPTDQPFLLQDSTPRQADIAVYESTTADDAIQYERLNLVVLGADQGVVQFMEMGALVNSGDRTFITANPQDQQLARGAKLSLPNGALAVRMQTGFTDQDVIAGIGGVQISSPILPGRHEFALSFQLPYNGSSADVSLQVPYATGAYSVYLPDTGLKLDTGVLQANGSTQMGGQSYALYSAANLGRATMVGARISGLGSTGGATPTQLAIASLGVVLFVLGGGVLLFGTRLRPAAGAAQWSAAAREQERLELIVRLAALDERFAAGDIGQADYEVERDRGKQRLRELTLARREPSPTTV